ncbi:MAG: HEAT repeat domain-containing protein [Anaerohalosphaeraceae bacterium]
MNTKLYVQIFVVLLFLSCPVFAQMDPSLHRVPETLLHKKPAELIKQWEGSSHGEQEAIQDLLFDNITESSLELRNKIVTGTQKEKLFACKMIAQMKDAESVPTLIQAIDDPSDKIKARAILSLKELHANQAADGVRQQMLKTKSKSVLKVSMIALGSFGDSQDVPRLRAYLPDTGFRTRGLLPDESVCVNAAAALALLGKYDGQALLLRATHSTNPVVKKEAIYSLGFVNTSDSQRRLQEIISDPNGQWKSYAEMALTQQKLMTSNTPQKIQILEKLVKDKSPRLSEWAVERIAEIDDSRAGDILGIVEKNKTEAGRKASRLLKVREGGR